MCIRDSFSSNEWKKNPTKHTSSGYISRYRFICKHFDDKEISEFIESEIESLNTTGYLDQAIGRVIAARYTLRSLPEILERRRADLGDVLSATVDRQLQVGFTNIMQQGFRTSEKLVAPTVAAVHLPETPEELESVQISVEQLQKFDLGELNLPTLPDISDWHKSWQTFDLGELNLSTLSDTSDWHKSWKNNAESLQELRYSEHDLITRIHFRSPSDPKSEGSLQRLYRLLFKRLPSLLAGREDLLWSELNNVREERKKQLMHRIELSAKLSQIYREHLERIRQQVNQMNQVYSQQFKQINQQQHHQMELSQQLEQMNQVYSQQLSQIYREHLERIRQQVNQMNQVYSQQFKQINQQQHHQMELSQQVEQIHKQLNERLRLLEILTEYDYR